MRNHVVLLVLVSILLFLFFSYASWTSGFVIQHGEEMNPSVEIFSTFSPLLIGFLIMGVVVLMIITGVERVRELRRD